MPCTISEHVWLVNYPDVFENICFLTVCYPLGQQQQLSILAVTEDFALRS